MKMACPTCKTDLVMAERQGVEIDYCPMCRGVWLDRGELDKIVERASADTGHSADRQQRGANRRRRDDDDDDDDRSYGDGQGQRSGTGPIGGGKRRSWLSDIFD